MDPSEDAPGSLDDDASSSEGASSVDYISEVSDAESTASEAAAAALEDVIDAVERRVDRQRRQAALRQFVRRVLRTTVRAALLCILGLAAAGAVAALERERGRWLTRCPLHAPCSEETFPCVGAITEPFAIPRGRVGDGVADCCGGSDEPHGDVSGCIRDAQQQLEEARREVARMELSMAARATLSEEAQFAAARAAVEDAQLRSDELRFSELQPRSYHEAAQLQAVRQKIQRLRVQAAGAYHQDPDVYGDDGAWLGLRGSCFDSPPLTEKSVLGGTSNVVARAYVFRVCPFKNVTQREADHMEWKRATARDEGKKMKRSKAVWKSTRGVGSTQSRHRAGVASMAWAAPLNLISTQVQGARTCRPGGISSMGYDR